MQEITIYIRQSTQYNREPDFTIKDPQYNNNTIL